MSIEIFLSRWAMLNPAEQIEVFTEIYRTLPGKWNWLEIAKETAVNLNSAECESFNTWWRNYRKNGEIS